MNESITMNAFSVQNDLFLFGVFNEFLQINLSECCSMKFCIDGIVITCFSRERHL